jgi:predicted TIM-barrel fold metal-dependent hydrolase
MEIFDCHTNIGWDNNNVKKNLYPTNQSVQSLLKKMNKYNVRRAIIVPFPSPGGQFSENFFWYEVENQNLVNAQRSSSRLLPFPAVNPNDSDSVKNIKTMAAAFGVKGIKFSHQIPMNFNIDKLINHPLMKIVRDYNLVVMIHIGTGKERGSQYVHTTLEYAIMLAKHYPQIRFILCHLGRLHSHIFDALQLPNVWMDTAGFSMSLKWGNFLAKDYYTSFKKMPPDQIIEHLVSTGYGDKILFGSDEPYTKYEDELSIIFESRISQSAMKGILGGNLERLLYGKN